jgi:organic radical activating enzyme
MSNIAKRLIPAYISMGLKVTRILDRDPELHGTMYNGIPVIAPGEFDGKEPIVICLDQVFMPVLRKLQNRGFKKILPYYFYIFDKEITLDTSTIEDAEAFYYDKWRFSRPAEDVLDSVDIPVTMKCSLRCKDCANLMQYFDKPAHAGFDLMQRSIEKLFNVVEHIFEVRVLGGEPFMFPDLYRYIEAIKQYSSKYTICSVLTNGTIIPSQKNLDALKDSKITLQISEYNNPRQRIPELLKLCEENEIITKIKKNFRWQNCAVIHEHRRTMVENTELLRNCCVRGTVSIVDGKLFFCPIAGNMYTLGAAPKEYHEFVPLADESIPNDELLGRINSLTRKTYLRVCDFCGGRPPYGNDIPAAVQTDKTLEYIRYEF